MQNPALFSKAGSLTELEPVTANGGQQLSLEILAGILFKSEAEIKNLSPEEQNFHLRIREMATMCGGWQAPVKRHRQDEVPTLREHWIY